MQINLRFPLTSVALGLALGLMAGTGLPVTAYAADAPAVTASLPDDEAQAWAEVQTAGTPMPRPKTWTKTTPPTKEEFKQWESESSEHFARGAAKAGEFIVKFPKSEHVVAARIQQIHNLSASTMPAPNPEREAEYARLMNAAVVDQTLSESDRFDLRDWKLHRETTLAARGRGGIPEKVLSDGLVALQKDFPKNAKVYDMMAGFAANEQSPDALKIAKIVVASPDAPAKAKAKAQVVVDGKNFNAAKNVGKPVTLKFTAVDGREVDLAKLKGKVVLVDFWATWCGPCVGEIPHVKEAYAKYHDQGFEVIGISFDYAGSKDKLMKFTKAKDMPWPQYFNDTGGDNKYADEFNVSAIPEMWLIGKDGNLADANARGNLADKVAKLLEL